MYILVDCYKEHVTGLAGSFKLGDRFGELLILGMVIWDHPSTRHFVTVLPNVDYGILGHKYRL